MTKFLQQWFGSISYSRVIGREIIVNTPGGLVVTLAPNTPTIGMMSGFNINIYRQGLYGSCHKTTMNFIDFLSQQDRVDLRKDWPGPILAKLNADGSADWYISVPSLEAAGRMCREIDAYINSFEE